WKADRGWPAASSPLVYQGYLYILERQPGLVNSFEAATGKPVYARERVGATAFWATPWANDGKIYCLDQDGQTHVLKAGPTFEVLGKNALNKELFWATPAAAGGALYIRGVDNLYCIAP